MTDTNPELRRLIREALKKQLKVSSVYAGGAYSGGGYSGAGYSGAGYSGAGYSGAGAYSGGKGTKAGAQKAAETRRRKAAAKKMKTKSQKRVDAASKNPYIKCLKEKKGIKPCREEAAVRRQSKGGVLVGGRVRRGKGNGTTAQKAAARQNPWVKHVKAFPAKAHRIGYNDALQHPNIRKGY